MPLILSLSDAAVGSVLSDVVYHSAGETINTSQLGWVQLAVPGTDKPLLIYDQQTGYYAEAWGKPNADGTGYSEIMQVSRGTVVSDADPNYTAAPLAANSNADMWKTLGDDAQVVLQDSTPQGYVQQGSNFLSTIQQYYSGVPIIEAGQSFGGFTADAITARYLADHPDANDVSAVTYNALPYTAGMADEDGVSAGILSNANITNYYVGNEQFTQNLVVGTPIGATSELPALPYSGPDILDSFTIHSTEAAVAETFNSEYPVGSPDREAALAQLASIYPNAAMTASQAPIAGLLSGSSSTSDADGSVTDSVDPNGALTETIGGANGYSEMATVTSAALSDTAMLQVSSITPASGETQEWQTSAFDSSNKLISDVQTGITNSGTVDSAFYNPSNTSAILEKSFLSSTGSTLDFYNTTGAMDAVESVNADSSGDITTTSNETINFAAGDRTAISAANASGNVDVTLTPNGGAAETLDVTKSGMSITVGANTLSESLTAGTASVNASGDIALAASGGTLTVDANGRTDNFQVGQSIVSIDAASLASVSSSNGTDIFNLNSAAAGYSESVNWNPATDKAQFDITTNATGQTFVSSLGQVASGDVLSISNTQLNLVNALGQVLDAEQVNPDGTQSDVSYDATGGSEYDNIVSFNAAGVTTEKQFNYTNSSSLSDFYNPAQNDALVAQQTVNINGSGSIVGDGQTIDYAAGDAASLAVAANGTVTTSIAPEITGGAAETIALSTADSETFTAGQDKISLAAGDTTTTLVDGLGDATFDLAHTSSNFAENIAWNPTTGKALLDLTNSAGTTVSESLGDVDPGDNLLVNGAAATLDNSAGQTIDGIQVNTDGSQVDTGFDLTGGTWKDYTIDYNNAGAETKGIFDNNDKSSITDIYDPAHGDGLSTQTVLNTDGSTVDSTFDLTGGTWKDTITDYNSAGVKTEASFDNNDNSSTIDFYDPAHGDALSGQNVVSSNGSQVDTGYDLTGGTWKDYVIDYNSADVKTEAVYDNNDKSSVTDIYDPSHGDGLSTQTVLNTDGSTVDSTYDLTGAAWKDTITDFNSAGVKTEAVLDNINGSSTTDFYDPTHSDALSGQNLVAIDGSQVDTGYDVVGGTWKDYVIDYNSADVETKAVYDNNDKSSVTDNYDPTHGDGLSTQTVLNTDGSTVDSTFDLTGGAWKADITDFNSGGIKTEAIVENNDNSSISDYYDPSHADALSVQNVVNADGSQVDTGYDLTGGTWKTYTIDYNNAGVETEAVYGNNDNSSVTDFYDPSQNDALVTQELVNSNGSGSVAWGTNGDNGSLSFTENSANFQINVSALQDVFQAIGSGIVTTSSDVTADIAANSTVSFNGSKSTIDLGSNDVVTDTGANDVVDATSGAVGDKVTLIGNSDATTLNGSSSVAVTGTGETVNATGDTVTLGSNTTLTVDGASDSIGAGSGMTGDKVSVIGSNDTTTLNGGSSVTVTGTGETVNATGDTVTLGSNTTLTVDGASDNIGAAAGVTGDNVNVVGNSDTTTLNGGSSVTVTGTGETVNATGDTVTLGSNTTLTVDGASDSIGAGAGVTGDNVNVVGNSDTTTLNGGSSATVTGTGETVNATGDTVTLGSNTTITVDGASDNIGAGSGMTGDHVTADGNSDTVSLNGASSVGVTGTGDTINASGDQVSFGNSSSATITGSGDTISGGSNDTLHVDGQNDSVSTSDSTVDFPDGHSGDTVTGPGDGGTGWPLPPPPPPPPTDTGGTSSSSSGFAGNRPKVAHTLGIGPGKKAQFDFTSGKGSSTADFPRGVAKVQQVIASDDQSEALNGGKWDTTTVTWSLADIAGAGAAAGGAYQAAVEQAFSAWSLATGLQFEEVSGSTPSDIQIGESDFDTQDTGRVGNTVFSVKNGQFEPGVSIKLESPAQDPLAANAAGQLAYDGTSATLTQVLEHEIGHALGFSDNDNPTSIMDYYLSGQNQTLSAMDTAAARSLYGLQDASTAGAWQPPPFQPELARFIQAIVSFGPERQGTLDMGLASSVVVPQPITVPLVAYHARVAG